MSDTPAASCVKVGNTRVSHHRLPFSPPSHYSTALLEKLVHANLVMPANQHYIEIIIPNGISYEIFQTAAHPGWDSRNEDICKNFAHDWYDERRSALLIVPSIPARVERNILIHPAHPEARGITYTMPEPVWWDERLYSRA